MLSTVFSINNTVVGVFNDKAESGGLINIATYRTSLSSIATFCKLSSVFNYDSAIDAYAVDDIDNKYRFTISYTVQSSTNNTQCRLVTKLREGFALASLQDLYPAFNWAEREVWDLLGIFFIRHPDLRRVLTYYGFSGHPLRKDFPVSGFHEVRYIDSIKQVAYGPNELSQSYRVSSIFAVWKTDNA